MIAIEGRAFLKKGRDGPVRGGNPWIFSQAIGRVEPAGLAAGAFVAIHDGGGDAIGLGYFNPATTIAIRLIAFDPRARVETIIEDRIAQALQLRRRTVAAGTDCYRLFNGDGDGLSGVVIDRYADSAVVQLLTAGADRMRSEIAAALDKLIAPAAIVERSAGVVRRQEGLPDRVGAIAGSPTPETIVVENGVRFAVDLIHGQKTGHFLDQRQNRALAAGLARNASMLDAYCHSGGFALAAAMAGARRVIAVDSSERALAAARRNRELNALRPDAIDFFRADAPRFLAEQANRADGERFGVVVLDPPPLARAAKDAAQAGRLYVDLNALAMRLVEPGGFLMTFSCSAHFCGEEFIRAVRIAQAKSGRKFRTLERLGPGPDHPVLLGHPEGEYLTGLLLAALD
ncbi:class I SAM-dependent rRNA methyltransferase [bacterium]|nr:class I SAM-dependent rRNA methyltransferase [bacterium]